MNPPDDDDDLITPEQVKSLRKGLIRALAKAGAAGNASAAKTVLEMIGDRTGRKGDTEEREEVLSWLAAHPEAGAAEATAQFWPGLVGEMRERKLILVRQWRHRYGLPEGAVKTTPAVVPRPEADWDWAALPTVPFLRRMLAEILADLTRARAQNATASSIATLDARAERAHRALRLAIAEAGDGDAALDQSPIEVAARIERREKLLDVYRRARARAAASGTPERDL